MAEFCLHCWNKLNGENFTERDYVLSEELERCEECGKWMPVIVRVRRCPALFTLRTWLWSRRYGK